MFSILEVYSLLNVFSFLISDQFIFGVFLLVNLFIGLWAGRGVKTIRDYSLGNKDFSTGSLTATIVATWISGSFMTFKLAQVYTEGWYFILPFIGNSFALLLTGLWLAPRMGEFLNNLSVAEALGDLYGKTVRIITAVCGILVSIGGVAIQFKVSAKVLTVVFGLNEFYATLAAATIVITYAALGGIRAVTFTDIVQFFTFGAFIPLLALVIWNGIKNPTAALEAIQASPQFDYRAFIHSPKRLMSSVALMLFYLIPAFVPTVFQRVSMGTHIQQVKRSFIYSFFLCLAITLFTIWIAILLVGQNNQVDPSRLFHYIIETYTYPGLKGLILVGTMSMVMSTADSHLNAAAVLLAHDIANPLRWGSKNQVRMAKLFSFIVGGLALLLALYKTDFLDLVLMAWGFYMPIVTVPLLLAIFGFRSSSRAVLIGMGAGCITVLIWDLYLAYIGINSIIPGMVANGVFLMGSHYMLKEKGGWVGIKDPAPLLAARQARKEQWKKCIYVLKHPNLYAYLAKNLPAYKIVYSLFGLYVIGATYAAFYTIPQVTIAAYQKLYDFITHSVLIATAVFLTYPAWPPRFKYQRFMAFFFPVGMMYILFMVGTMLVFLSSFHEVQVMIFLLNLVMAALLLPWPLMSVLAVFGTLVGCLAFNLYQGPIQVLPIASSIPFKLTYGILLVSSFLIALFRLREKQTKLESQHGYLLHSHAAIKEELARVLRYREELLKELNPAEIKLFDEVTTNYLQQAIYRVRDYMRLEVSEINIDALISELKALLPISPLQPVPQLLIDRKTKLDTFQADMAKIKQLLLNSISYLQAHNPDHEPITIILEDTRLGYELAHMPHYLKKIAAIRITITTVKEIPVLEEVYIGQEEPSIQSLTLTAELLPLLENARIIDAHYGHLEQNRTDLHMYVIPVNLREVRGKVMELLREPTAADPTELSHPLAIQLEKELFAKLQGIAVDLQVIHQALDLIKQYHGGIKRQSGEPFFTHPMQVALIVLAYSQDQDSIVAALLHDLVEDSSLSLAHIQAMFGKWVGFLVAKATNLENKLKRITLADHENLHRLMNYQDQAAALVKLADRLHNMRTITGHSSLAKQKEIAKETLTFFVPLARHLQFADMAQELEKLSLKVLEK